MTLDSLRGSLALMAACVVCCLPLIAAGAGVLVSAAGGALVFGAGASVFLLAAGALILIALRRTRKPRSRRVEPLTFLDEEQTMSIGQESSD